MSRVMRLEHFGADHEATWSRLVIPDLPIRFAVSPPWRFNRRRESRIPDGFYELVRHESQVHPNAWAFVGPGVTQYETPGVPRFACLLHAANWAHELEGCTGPGDSIQMIRGKMGVTNSRNILSEINGALELMKYRDIEVVSLNS
jgi:hypothetical protein